jgi:ribosomal-protein-alanine N-acetyltransferase
MNLKIDEHLSLGYFNPGDIVPLAEFMNDITIYNNTLRPPYPYTLRDAEIFIGDQIEKQLNDPVADTFAIRLDGKIIGCIGFMPIPNEFQKHSTEIGYSLSKDYRKKGIMSKTVGFFCDQLFNEHGFVKLIALTFADNIASKEVLEKNGFVEEGFLKRHFIKNDKYIDCRLYALIKDKHERN